MTNSFDDARFTWKGQTFVIPANAILGAIARVEDVFTFHELLAYSGRQTAPIGKLAEAFGAVLRYAGANVTNDEVYEGMFGSLAEGQGGAAQTAIRTLALMMVPKSKRAEIEQSEGKTKPAAKKTTRKRSPAKKPVSSKARIKR